MKSLWNDKEAGKCKDRLDLLVYSSRLLGMEPKLCVWGGGNTSSKTIEKDHCGRKRNVLRIKGSGSDLKVSTRNDYPPVDLDELNHAFSFKKMTDQEMVDYVARCLLEPKAPRPSIEVLLHAFVDQPDIHHTHADAILSLTNTKNNRAIVRRVFGDKLLWVPYVKPGFTLAKWVGAAYRKNPKAEGLVLEKHGLITWGPDAKTSYQRTIKYVTAAEKYLASKARSKKFWSPQIVKSLTVSGKKEFKLKYYPVIRSAVSRFQKAILYFNDSPQVMAFVNSKDAARVSQIGPATPDHMLRTKRIPLFIKVPAKGPEGLTSASLVTQIEAYALEHKRYFQRHKRSLETSLSNGAARMLDPYPKVILIPGFGMVTTGKDFKSAAIVSEIYEHSISVMTSASAVGRYDSLSEKLAFEMDYWPMELYKLSLQPAEAVFSRYTGLVTGAARGIGKSIAAQLAAKGAVVYLADLDFDAVKAASEAINKSVKAKRAFPLHMDVTRIASVQSGIEKIVLDCGGIDFLVSNAGIAHVAPIHDLEEKDWEKSLRVNATGHFLVSREVVRVLKRQNMGGSIVFIASKNVLAPGKDFGAYSAAKAAESQLGRILAIENGEHHIRVNLVNPDGVFEDSGLWDKIRGNRAKSYGIAPAKLQNLYINRNLMKTEVLPEDVADAVSYLISEQSSKTTGCILTVDGGVKEAFPR